MPERKLTTKREAFIAEYLKDLNATRAAIAVGYSEATACQAASRILRDPAVKERIKEYLDTIKLSPQRILAELAAVAFGSLKDVAEWNESGISIKPSYELDDVAAGTIAEISETTSDTVTTLKIKRHDKLKALELLGRYQKLFQENSQPINVAVGIKVTVEDYGRDRDKDTVTAKAEVVSEDD